MFANFRPSAALVRDQVASIAAAPLERGAKLWQHEPWTKLGLSLLVMLNVIIINLPGSHSWDILKHWDTAGGPEVMVTYNLVTEVIT